MILNDFECRSCGNIEERVESFNVEIAKCPKCGGVARKIITIGGIITDENARWLPSVIHQCKPDYDKTPVETRSALKNYLSEHGLCWTG